MVRVVTGATGHIGANLTRALLDRGHRVRAVSRTPSHALDGLSVEWVPADVLDPRSLRGAFDGADVVYHLAGRISITGDPDGLVWATNVIGVRNVVQAALSSGVRRLVHCSSIHAFDLGRVDTLDEAGPRALRPGLPPYDRAKAAGEEEVGSAVERGLDAVIVNPTGVIGPCDFGPSRMGRFFLALWTRRLPAIVGGGFDWVDVRDVAVAVLAAGERGRRGERYLLPGHRHAISELAEMAADVSGIRGPRISVPPSLARLAAPLGTVVSRRTGNPLMGTSESLRTLRLGSRLTVSGARAARELGHTPRPAGHSIHDLHAWFLSNGMLAPARDKDASPRP
jgi:dihydroflavonol-4-reductase